MSAVRTSDGGAACGSCLHVAVPAIGSVAFPLTPGVYRVVVETGDAFSAVGVSATFTINAATTTTTTTAPSFPVSSPDVYNGLGELVVLDDALRSGFDVFSGQQAAPIVGVAKPGRAGLALALNVNSGHLIRGVSKGYSSGVRFWAKADSTNTNLVVKASSGGQLLGFVPLIVDSAWHEYVLPFDGLLGPGQDLIIAPLVTLAVSTVLVDDMGLVKAAAPTTTVTPTTQTPPGHFEPRVVLDWKILVSCYRTRDALSNDPWTYDCNFESLGGSPPTAFLGWRRGLVAAADAYAVLTDAGAVNDDPYGLQTFPSFTKMKTVQEWVLDSVSPTTTTVPQRGFPDWGVQIYQSTTPQGEVSYRTRGTFGTPPNNLGDSVFLTLPAAVFNVTGTGAVADSPGSLFFTHYSAVAPVTTIPATTIPTTTTTPTRPAAFSSYPNYLRSQKLKNDGAVAQCLTPGGSSIQSLAASCDAGNALLSFTWDATARGYLVKQGSTCLQVDYNAPDPQVLLPSGSPAAKVGWVTCGSTGPGAVWVPTFVETDASNAGWYQLVPNARPGVPTPCLNLNLGASQSTQMLVEYTCQGGTHTEERWAPNESFWVAPGGTGGTGGTPTTPTTTSATIVPNGAHSFVHGLETPIETTDGRCITQTAAGQLGLSNSEAGCMYFVPSLVGEAAAPWAIVDQNGFCLGGTSYLLLMDCDGLSRWSDVSIQPNTAFKFRFKGDDNSCLDYQFQFVACLSAPFWFDRQGTLPRTKISPFDPELIPAYSEIVRRTSELGALYGEYETSVAAKMYPFFELRPLGELRTRQTTYERDQDCNASGFRPNYETMKAALDFLAGLAGSAQAVGIMLYCIDGRYGARFSANGSNPQFNYSLPGLTGGSSTWQQNYLSDFAGHVETNLLEWAAKRSNPTSIGGLKMYIRKANGQICERCLTQAIPNWGVSRPGIDSGFLASLPSGSDGDGMSTVQGVCVTINRTRDFLNRAPNGDKRYLRNTPVSEPCLRRLSPF
jgi:hypothetical protein